MLDTQPTTYQRILDSALTLMQQQGYHAFSYADVAAQVGIRKASIHYYFPGKCELARSVVARYRSATKQGLRQLELALPDPAQQLGAYIGFFGDEVGGQPRICLCALLATEMPTLPNEVRAEVQGYYQEHEAWLCKVLEAGQHVGSLRFSGPTALAAQTLLAGLEGAMLAARAHSDVQRFRTIAAQLLLYYRVA